MTVILAMCLFAISMSFTPGPVNFISLSAGVNHGFKKSIPFVFGATVSFILLLILIMLGLGKIATENPVFLKIVAILGCGFICYLGFKTALSSPHITVKNQIKKPRFLQGFLLTWLNPKAWIAGLAGISAFNLSNDPASFLIFISLYFVFCLMGIGAWAYLGTKISILLKTPAHVKNFNRVMGACLILIAVYLLISQGYLAL